MSNEHLVGESLAERSLAEQSRPGHAHDAPASRPDADKVRPLLALLAGCVVYLVLRLSEQGGLERDEAEMVYLAQHLSLGYGAQPPLYTWLQWLAFRTFGLDRFAMVIVKALVLTASYAAMYRAAHAFVGRRAALAVAVSLVLFPQIGWEAPRIQTHSALMLALACGLLWAYAALLARPATARYAVFGLLAGLGILAKYNFTIFLAGMVGASLLVPEHRQLLWTRRTRGGLLLAFVIGLLVLLPHAAWIAQHLDAAFTGTLHKVQDGTGSASYPARLLQGVLSLASGLAGFVAVPVLLCAAILWPVRRELRIDVHPPAARFFLWLYGICLLQLGVLVLAGVVGLIKQRWLMPVLFSLPLAAFVIVPALKRPVQVGKIVRTAGVAALVLLTLLPVRIWLGPVFGRTVAAHYPYGPLADALLQRYPAVRAVMTGDVMLAGNLDFVRHGLRTLLLDDARRAGHPLIGQVLLVTQDKDEPELLATFRAAFPEARLVGGGKLALPLRLGGAEPMQFYYRCFEPGPRATPP